MSKIFNYKYYILNKSNRDADGVLEEIMGKIRYHSLRIEKIYNQFTGEDEDVIVKYPDSPDRESDSSKLAEHFNNVELTQDYWTAWEHMTGRKRKAINTNDTTAG